VIETDYKYCNLKICNGLSSLSGDDALKPKSYGEIVSTYPFYVKFCHDSACNLKCITCRDDYIFNSREKTEELDAIIGTHLLPSLKDAHIVSLNGSGELFASRHCRRLVKEITSKYPNVKFAIHTNGILCDEKNCGELGVLGRLDSVQVSINAMARKTYDKIMRGGGKDNYVQVWRNVKWLAGLKKSGGLRELRFVFVVSALNYMEMKPFLERALTLGAIVDFWEYRPWGNEMANHYRKMAVFDPSHKDYGKLARIIRDPIFKSPNCYMDEVLKETEVKKAGFKGLFSLKQENNHNIFTFMGLKFSFKRKSVEKILNEISFTHEWHRDALKNINRKFDFTGKIVYEIGADLNLECAQAVIKLGAKKVFAANPQLNITSPHKDIVAVKELGENAHFEDEKFDLIFGIALLEHVLKPTELAREISRLLKTGGNAYLQGWPMWCGPEGHHMWAKLTKEYYFNNHDACCVSWYHLTSPTQEEFTQHMLARGVILEDIPILYDFAIKNPHISRLSSSEIIEAFENVSDLKVKAVRDYTNESPNAFYEKAKERYSEDDLRTLGLTLYITKK
jgi:MoaA/NifB/PqqE/SkfB family radical SAM enzyme/SAM-dependent methyltransferase